MPPHHELQSVAPWQLSHCTTSVLQDEIPIDTTLCARVRPRLEPFLPILRKSASGSSNETSRARTRCPGSTLRRGVALRRRVAENRFGLCEERTRGGKTWAEFDASFGGKHRPTAHVFSDVSDVRARTRPDERGMRPVVSGRKRTAPT
jgi:hypothetical protein